METDLDCLPCFIRQALDACRMTVSDQDLQRKLMRDVLRWCSEMDLSLPPPVMGQKIHRHLRSLLKNRDPYLRIKKEQNQMADLLLKELEGDIGKIDDSLELAVRLAVAGNVIDLGALSRVDREAVLGNLKRSVTEPLSGDYEFFARRAKAAETVLYLTDNAGEIVFDRLLIKALLPARVTVAVRGGPVINDATLEDAEAVGIFNLAEVIDNGSDVPGTILSDCNESFRSLFDSVDMVIAKGQGNYETLCGESREIFFLFKVKCGVIAGHTGMRVDSHVVLRHAREAIHG